MCLRLLAFGALIAMTGLFADMGQANAQLFKWSGAGASSHGARTQRLPRSSAFGGASPPSGSILQTKIGQSRCLASRLWPLRAVCSLCRFGTAQGRQVAGYFQCRPTRQSRGQWPVDFVSSAGRMQAPSKRAISQWVFRGLGSPSRRSAKGTLTNGVACRSLARKLPLPQRAPSVRF